MVENEWKRRINKEVKELYGEPRITAVARSQRIRWLGHVGRMDSQTEACFFLICCLLHFLRKFRRL